MFTKLKNLLKRIFPIPTNSFYKIVGERFGVVYQKLESVLSSVRYQHKETRKTIQDENAKVLRSNELQHIETKNAILDEYAKITKNSELQQKDRYLDLAIMQKQTDQHALELIELQQKHQKQLLENLAFVAQQQERMMQLLAQERVIGELQKISSQQQEQQMQLADNLAFVAQQQEHMMQLLAQERVIVELQKISSQQLEQHNQLAAANCGIIDYAKRNNKLLWDNLVVSRESVWGHIFNNAISGSDWMKEKNFAPGRWAIGYPMLYVLYSILSKAKPQHILELGLGQSTHMITQYATANPEAKHTVVEQNAQWIDFFRNDHTLAVNTEIIQLDCIDGTFKDDTTINIYNHFKETVGSAKYDFILIDAPVHNKVSKYSRVDVLSILPDSLSDRFVILMDDYNRPGEENTAREISTILNANGIQFVEGNYFGEKRVHIWASEDQAYLCTL